jgi:hypothetical protein
MLSQNMSSGKIFDHGKIFKLDEVSTASPSANSVFVQKNEFQTKMSSCSIFELETSPWRQKLRLDLLISELPSEQNSEVGNVLKIDRRCWLL